MLLRMELLSNHVFGLSRMPKLPNSRRRADVETQIIFVRACSVTASPLVDTISTIILGVAIPLQEREAPRYTSHT